MHSIDPIHSALDKNNEIALSHVIEKQIKYKYIVHISLSKYIATDKYGNQSICLAMNVHTQNQVN